MSQKIKAGWIKTIEIAAEVLGLVVFLIPLFTRRKK